MPEGAEVVELQRRGLNARGFVGAQPLEEGNCHGTLPIIAIGKRELTFDTRSTQGLQALNEAELLCGTRDLPPQTSVTLAACLL